MIDMVRNKKDWAFLSIRCDRKAYNELNEIVELTGLTKTKAIEFAINNYYKKNFEKDGEDDAAKIINK